MKKRIISLLLALCMVLSLAPVSVFAESDGEEPGTYTPAEEDGVYLLDSEEALLWLAEQVNGGNGALSVRLTDNIELSGEWTPIGTEDNPFSGSFDGDGYTISGLSINVELGSDSADGYFGLFGYVKGKSATNRAEICDLTLEGTVEVSDALTATNQGGAHVAGVAGFAGKADISGVISKVDVTNAKDTDTGKYNPTGGIAADAYDVHFTNCANTGWISSYGDYVGGIAGGRVFTVDGCYNSGVISGVERIGGIVGYTVQGTSSCEVRNCYNMGTISGTEYAGGIVGWMKYGGSAVDACTVENCYNTGVVFGDSDGHSGTLIGCCDGNSKFVVRNCYTDDEPAFGTNTSSAASAEVIGDDELKALAETLGDSFKPDYGNVNDGFPVLYWQESECAHEETETVYKSNDNGKHTVTVTCAVCGEAQGDAETEDCVDADEDGKCDKCEYVFPVSADVNYISKLWGGSAYSKTDDNLLTLNEDNAYEVNVIDSEANLRFWMELTEDAPSDAVVQIVYYNTYAEDEQTKEFAGSTRLDCPWAMWKESKSMDGATLKLQVLSGSGDEQKVVQETPILAKKIPTLTNLSLAEVPFDTSFATTLKEYTATTIAESVTVNVTTYGEAYGLEYALTYNGSESNEVALELGENTIEVVVSYGDAQQTYTITVTRVEQVEVTFEVTPENAVVNLVDKFGARVMPDENGVYTVMGSTDYTVTVTASGYVGYTATLNRSESGTETIALVQAEENTDLNTDLDAEWPNFRNGENHLGITDAKTPYDPEDAELLWAVKYGTGWSAAPGSPILVDDCIITYIGSSIKKLDKNTGEVLAEGKMVGSSSYSIVPATYAEGMVFVGLSGGRIQAFNAETLESLWVYTDALKGQPNCPITYKDGYIYAGFWNSETKDANFACISVTDEDPNETNEAKLASWTYSRTGGFYWAGAYASANGKYIVVGTDDGASSYTTESASLLVFEAASGKLVDSWDGIRGDIRSNVSYDPDSDRVFFTSKGGVLCNAKINWETGEISDKHTTVITDANGSEYAMSTCTPSVYHGRIYIGTSGNGGNFNGTGFCIAVYELQEDGSMVQAYTYAMPGYPQTSAMVSVGYVTEEDDSVYIYLPYNAKPGGMAVLKDAPGQTEPITTTDEGYSEVFTPVSPLSQYCICSTIADSYGTIYYKNDSCYMMAITSKILSLEASKDIGLTYDKSSGKLEVTSGSLYVTMKNGLTRDVSDYVTYDRENGQLVYTYGFDNANYGLKTVTLDWCFHADMDRTYTPVEGKEGVQHTASVVCSTCGATVKETVNCTDADKNGQCDDCGAKIADAGLKLQEGDTFSKLVSWYPIDGTAEALSVSATSNYPSGKLSYQWYYTENEGSYKDPTLVEDAVNASFTPATDAETNMRFYFCVVTLTVGENSWTAKSAQQAVIACPQPTVTAYFSLTDDDVYVVGDNGAEDGDGGSGEVLAMKEITVPYFDLALYGLQNYYFVSETYDSGDQQAGLLNGNSTYAFGKITALHLYLYAMEVHYCGLDESEAGKGYLKDAGLLGSDALMISGSSGSLYMNRFWGHDENLTYYVNYEYPLASGGWGSTSDQILLEDGDIVSVSMYSSWSMFIDSGYGYHHLGTEDDKQMTETTVSVGTESLELTLYRACVDDWASCTTAQVVVTDGIDVYYADVSDLPGGKVTAWKKAGTTDENGKITLNFSELNLEQGKTYLFAVAGQTGVDYPDDIVSCPGGILVKMLKPASGDVNSDGVLNLQDVLLLQQYVAKRIGADKLNLEAADMNGDGIINIQDVLLLQKRVANGN